MKKILSIPLALALAFSLSVPALAAGSATENTYSLYAAYEPAEDTWAEWKAAYIAAHPVEVAAFLANADNYWENEYWASDYYTKEEYMAEYDLATQAEFAELLLDIWLRDVQESEADKAILDTKKTAMGGVPGELSVLLNGVYLKFPDARPEAVNGRTMVPLRAIVEAMGGEVTYASGDGGITCVLGGATLSFAVGGDTVTVTRDGETTGIVMDCACYVKGNRTYVPVRFISQAAGYDVLWDADLQTVVVIDKNAIIAEIDKNFTILNRMLAALSPDPEQNYQTAASMKADLTELDSINGNHTYSFSGNMDVLQSADAINISGSVNLANLTRIEKFNELLSYSGLSALERLELTAALSKVDFSCILDLVGNTSYVQLPLMAFFSDGAYGAEDWISSGDLGGTAPYQARTVGTLLYLTERSKYEIDSFYTHPVDFRPDTMVTGEAERLASLIGDGRWSKSGTSDVFHFGLEDYAALTAGQYDENIPFAFKALEITVTAAKDGTASFSYTVQPEIYYFLEFRFTGSGNLSLARQQLTTEFHFKNLFIMNIQLTSNTKVTTAEPVRTPPAGSNIISDR